MTFQIVHSALYFTDNEIDIARSERGKHDHLQAAWSWLLATSGDVLKETKPTEPDGEPIQHIKPWLTQNGQLIEAAFRHRFDQQAPALAQTKALLGQGLGLQDQESLFETITVTLAAAHAVEMVRADFPEASRWLARFDRFSASLQSAHDQASWLDQQWLMVLDIVAGVLLDDHDRLQSAMTRYQHVIDSAIHPEGYFKPLASNPPNAERAFHEMTLACAALTLTAEAAAHVDMQLWQYENRDVGINTAITYLVYYYFYPDKWRWGEETLNEEQTQAIFRADGAWLEMATRRVNPRGVELLLDDQRPFFNPYMGGLTTLSHFKTEKRRRRGLFG
ncbi:MAG: alginate lyase family protein [Anaerolineae bacterium]